MMVQFDFLPCDEAPLLEATCSVIAFDAVMTYPLSYGETRTALQEAIDTRMGVTDMAPRVDIGEMQAFLRKGNILAGLNVYFGRVEVEPFVYADGFEHGPLIALALRERDIQPDDVSFDEPVAVKIDQERRVVRIDYGERRPIHQTFSLADDLIVHVDQDMALVDMVFRNIRWIDIENEPGISSGVPSGNRGVVRSLCLSLARYVRALCQKA